MDAVGRDSVDGVRVLLKHGANREVGTSGDCLETSPLEAAVGKPEILALLQSPEVPTYIRKTDPPLPQGESLADQRVNRQGDIRDASGLVFQTEAIDPQ